MRLKIHKIYEQPALDPKFTRFYNEKSVLINDCSRILDANEMTDV